MNTFESISPKKDAPQKRRPEKPQKKFTRRDILKVGAILAAGVLAKQIPISDNKKDNFPTDEELAHLDEKLEKIIRENEPTERQQNIERSDIDSIGKTFTEQLEAGDTITLDKDTRSAIYTHWRYEYRTDSINYKDGLVAGLERMQPWIAEIKKIFAEHGVPQKYIYLAIAESHFDMKATSHKAAVGPYQIIEDTAHDYDLRTEETYDERRDPIKSAELCAKYLKKKFEKFGGNTDDDSENEEAWRLALLAYNGGFVNKYDKYIIEQDNKAEITFRDDEHVVQKGDSLYTIAQAHNTSVILLRRANWGEQTLSDKAVRKLKVGKSLKLPQKRTKITIDGFDTWLESEINQKIQNEVTENVHVTKSGDTLSDIANKYNISIEDIKNNNNLTSTDIKIGQKLKLPPLDQSHRIKKILESISFFHENINYPDKFFAIHDVMQQNTLDKQFINAKKYYKEIEPPRTNITHFAYTVQSGDNLTKVIQRLKKQHPQCAQSTALLKSMFVRSNKLKNEHAIRSGQNLVLDFPLQRPATLGDIAKKYSINITKLHDLNPAITKTNVALSKNATLRIPK